MRWSYTREKNSTRNYDLDFGALKKCMRTIRHTRMFCKNYLEQNPLVSYRVIRKIRILIQILVNLFHP